MDSSDVFEPNWDEAIELFEDMDLKEELLRGIFAYGFEKPTTIQKKVIRPMILGRNTISQAQSGTGKTAAIAISMLQTIDISISRCQALILVPAWELAVGISRVVSQIGEFLDVRCQAFTGGVNSREDIRTLERGVHVVVGTPDRIFDMISRQYLQINSLKLLILDEADEMLSRRFNGSIKKIFALTPSKIQYAVFSATITPEILQITEEYMEDPVRILVKSTNLTLEGIKQYYIAVEREEQKLDTLLDLDEVLAIKFIIYVNTRRKVEQLAASMKERDIVVCAMYGEIELGERMRLMEEFLSGTSRVMITTDLLARGFDTQLCSLVVNFDLPRNYENYLYRIGRSWCSGRKGVAISFVTEQDAHMLKDLEQHYHTKIEELPVDFNEIL